MTTFDELEIRVPFSVLFAAQQHIDNLAQVLIQTQADRDDARRLIHDQREERREWTIERTRLREKLNAFERGHTTTRQQDQIAAKDRTIEQQRVALIQLQERIKELEGLIEHLKGEAEREKLEQEIERPPNMGLMEPTPFPEIF